GVGRHEAGSAQGLAQALVVLDERARDAVTDGAGLAGDTTAVDLDGDIEAADELHRLERLTHDHAPGLAAEELIERALVHRDAPAAGLEVHARGGGLAPTGAVASVGSRCNASRSY